MFIEIHSDAVRFTGRWKKYEHMAVTTAPGSMVEFAFAGKSAVMHFDMATNRHTYGHLWVWVDDGAKVEVPMERFLRVTAAADGNHVVHVVYKSSAEIHHRWYQPLEAVVPFQRQRRLIPSTLMGSLWRVPMRIIS